MSQIFLKGLENLIMSVLYQSTGKRFTASIQALNDSCCDHKVFRSISCHKKLGLRLVHNVLKSMENSIGQVHNLLDCLCPWALTMSPVVPKGPQNLIISALYRSIWWSFTASIHAVNDSCCDHKVFRNKEEQIKNRKKILCSFNMSLVMQWEWALYLLNKSF